MPTQITNAITSILRDLPPPGKFEVYDYDRDFDKLWGNILGTAALPFDGLVICGIDAPSRQLPETLQWGPFAKHLSAISWAAARRLRHPDSPVRVLLVGDTEQGPESAAGKLGVLYRARSESGSPLVPGIQWLQKPNRVEVETWFKNVPAPNDEANGAFDHLLRDTVWDGLTSNREGHHSVSNVLGALLLRKAPGINAAVSSPLEEYFHALVRSLITTDVAPGGGIPDWKPSGDKAIPAAVLIDDMAELWSPFLRGALGLDGQSSHLHVFGEHDFRQAILALPTKLGSLLLVPPAGLTVAHLVGDRKLKAKDFILFLDLRLFSGDEAASGEFYEKMCRFGQKLIEKNDRWLPWLSADEFLALEEELQAAQRPVIVAAPADAVDKKGRANPVETLLPRLLSLLDPTLPIVIFSSTHRAELTEPFKNYGNIITCFRKPMLSELHRGWKHVLPEVADDFRRAVGQAISILKARRLLRNLQP